MGLFFVSKDTYNQSVKTMNDVNEELSSTKVKLLDYLQKNNSMFDLTSDIIKQYVPIDKQAELFNKINTVWKKEEDKKQTTPTAIDDKNVCSFSYVFEVSTVFGSSRKVANSVVDMAKNFKLKVISCNKTKSEAVDDYYLLLCEGTTANFDRFKSNVKVLLTD